MDPTTWNLPFPGLVAALFVIVMLRANGTYWLGRLGTAGVRRTRLARLLESPGYLSASERIDRFGPPVVALSFLTIGFQTVVNLAAGVTGLDISATGAGQGRIGFSAVGAAGPGSTGPPSAPGPTAYAGGPAPTGPVLRQALHAFSGGVGNLPGRQTARRD